MQADALLDRVNRAIEIRPGMVECGLDEPPDPRARSNIPAIPFPRIACRFAPFDMLLITALKSRRLCLFRPPDRELRNPIILRDDRAAQQNDEKNYPLHSFCAISLY